MDKSTNLLDLGINMTSSLNTTNINNNNNNNADLFSNIRMSQLLDLNGFVNAFDSVSPATSTFQSFQNHLLQQSQQSLVSTTAATTSPSSSSSDPQQHHQQQPQQQNQQASTTAATAADLQLQQIQQQIQQLQQLQQSLSNNVAPPSSTTTFNQFQQQQQQQQTNTQINNNNNNTFRSPQPQSQQQSPSSTLTNSISNLFEGIDLQSELKEVYTSLHTLSQESLQHLFFLSRALQPQVTEDLRFSLVNKMFADVPKIIEQLTPSNIQAYASDTSNHAFKLFLDFKELANLLGRVSYIQLFQLTNNLVSPGTPQSQFSQLQRIQEYFQRCSPDQLRLLNQAVATDSSSSSSSGPGGMGNQRLLQIDPTISIDIMHFVSGIVSLPLNELTLFQQWFVVLSKKMLAVLLAMLQLESSTVYDLKRILASSHLPTLPSLVHQHQQQQQLQQQFNIQSNNILSNPVYPSTSSPHHHHQNNQTIVNPPPIIITTPTSSNNQDPLSLRQSSLTTPPNLMSSEFTLSLPPLFPSLNLSNSINNIIDNTNTNYNNPVSTTSLSPSHTSTSNNITKSPVKNEPPLSPQPPSLVLNTSASSILASSSSTDDCPFYLKIARQPPSETVYQRILKPFPSVMLCGPGIENANLSNFFVEASLLRHDNQTEIPTYLDGNKISRISNGTFAPFKKLKILSTTISLRTLFRIKFVLKRYVGNDFQTISKASVLSDPIEVFSHTIYLSDKQDVPLPPTVTEVIPSQGAPNTRMVVLGNNFVKSDNLSVMFGPTATGGQFYEKGTIICNAPERDATVKSGQSVHVNVANDGENYSTDTVSFTYTR